MSRAFFPVFAQKNDPDGAKEHIETLTKKMIDFKEGKAQRASFF